MFDPDNRSLLLESLRPPNGFKFDRGIATTFTIDFDTALMAPIALAGFSLSDRASEEGPDLLSVTQALEAVTQRLDIFAQSGMINLSSARNASQLITLLEPILHDVGRPSPGHIFHPKMWLLRFCDAVENLSYRCVITTRNITRDRSWDMMLVLESDPDLTTLNDGNTQLVRLVKSLGNSCLRKLPADRLSEIDKFADQLRFINWEAPPNVDTVRFYAFGVKGLQSSKPEGLFRGYGHLVVSPFVTSGALRRILEVSKGEKISLVARAEEIDALDLDIKTKIDAYIFPIEAALDSDSDESTPSNEAAGIFGNLHAKVYVVESERKAFIYIGSANATEAAFSGNTEVLVELCASAANMGIEAIFGEKTSFRKMLIPYQPANEKYVESEKDKIKRILRAYVVDLCACRFKINLTAENDLWTMSVNSSENLPKFPEQLKDASISVATVFSKNEIHPMEAGKKTKLNFRSRSLHDVTPFLVATVSTADKQNEASAVIRAELIGAPASRSRDVLVRLIDTPEKFLRFLQLVLAITDGGFTGFEIGVDEEFGFGGSRRWLEQGLFETLLNALANDASAFERLGPIVERIVELGDSNGVLPPGWSAVWGQFQQARIELKRVQNLRVKQQ